MWSLQKLAPSQIRDLIDTHTNTHTHKHTHTHTHTHSTTHFHLFNPEVLAGVIEQVLLSSFPEGWQTTRVGSGRADLGQGPALSLSSFVTPGKLQSLGLPHLPLVKLSSN